MVTNAIKIAQQILQKKITFRHNSRYSKEIRNVVIHIGIEYLRIRELL